MNVVAFHCGGEGDSDDATVGFGVLDFGPPVFGLVWRSGRPSVGSYLHVKRQGVYGLWGLHGTWMESKRWCGR